ncbi:hypothetical protein ACRQ5Q_13695 [Bradyrhizobium sp. PMVTL-01]|uniref:hypothetical protein n=1 Tax=Bradyrhizobium sp. PMVTL-01 TaxID=3434999 RepID=UPI003F715D42
MWKYIVVGLAILIGAEVAYIGAKMDEVSVRKFKSYIQSQPAAPTAEQVAKLKQAKAAILLEEAKLAVRNNLRDPTSALFTEEDAIGDDAVCGNVNAKNGFGGYVGKSAFIYTRTEGVTIAKDRSEAYGIDARCSEAKLKVLKAMMAEACKTDQTNHPSCKQFH